MCIKAWRNSSCGARMGDNQSSYPFFSPSPSYEPIAHVQEQRSLSFMNPPPRAPQFIADSIHRFMDPSLACSSGYIQHAD